MQFMRKYLCLFALLLITGVLPAQEALPAAKPPGARPDYSKEAFVDEEDLTSIVFENDGTSTREASTRVLIQSDAGVQRFGVLTYPYQSAVESVEIVYVRVKKPDGSVVNTPAENVQDMPSDITRQAPFYSDLHEKHVAVKGLGVGDVLETQVRWGVTKPLAPGQFWFAYNFTRDFIIQHEELRISVPRGRALKWKSTEVQPIIKEEGARRIFTWTHAQLQHKSDDETKKYQEEQVYLTSRGKLPMPDVQISTFQSWEEIGAWYDSLQSERVKPSPEIQAKAAELTRDAKDEEAKLHAIYNYVSTQFRYIGVAFGIGRYQPHAASEVLANQYGDCKDKHTLLASLLEAAGIKAYPALISATHDMDLDVPSPAQFDHVITAVPQGNGFVWLDTTAEVAPYGYLVGPLQDKQALTIPPDKTATLTKTSIALQTHAVQTFKMSATLSDDGTLNGKVESSASGDDTALVIRTAFRRIPMPQWKDLIQRISYASGFSGDVSEVSASSAQNLDEPIRWSYQYRRKDYPDWASHRISSPLPLLPFPNAEEKPSHPIWLGPILEVHYESIVQLPKGYQPQVPPRVDLKESFAEYHAAYSASAGVLRTDRRLITKVREVPLSDYDAYKKFTKAVSEDRETYVAASSGLSDQDAYQAAIWNLPDSINAEAMQAYQLANDNIDNNVPATIEALKHAVDLDPKFVRAWLWLGQLYIFRRDRESAVDAFRKALNANPHELLSYKLLAMTLARMERYQEAADVWRSLMVTAPDEADGPAGLASAMFALKRYAEAADAYESALKLNPNRAGLEAQLGMSYLNSGDEDKAVAAYKKTVEMDPQPLWFNNIAYALAVANKQIPMALQYAERAVKDEEDISAKIKLAELKKEDLGYTLSLPAYWDTLGWVLFRLGNYDVAEKYLNAAWTVLQDPTAADHLGQVYEAQHQKEKAAGMYRLALEASHSPNGMKETKGRLASLGSVRSNGVGVSGAEDLSRMRTFKLQRITSETVSAEFFILIERGSRVVDVKRVSGSEKLDVAEKALRSVSFDASFPDGGPGLLLRRGILSCYPVTGCSLVLYNPFDVHSVD